MAALLHVPLAGQVSPNCPGVSDRVPQYGAVDEMMCWYAPFGANRAVSRKDGGPDHLSGGAADAVSREFQPLPGFVTNVLSRNPIYEDNGCLAAG